MGEYTFLPYAIVLVLVEYAAVIKLSFVWAARQDEQGNPDRDSDPPRWLGLFEAKSFLSCSKGLFGPTSSLVLLVTRLVSFLFFLVIGMGTNFARPQARGHWQYFTNWNLGLIAGYYLVSFLASSRYVYLSRLSPATLSAQHPKREGERDFETPRMVAVGSFVGRYFTIASTTALFITAVNFTLLDPTPRFYNLTAHCFTSLSFFVEMSLNCIPLHKNEFVLCMSWVVIWMVFIWPIVYFGVKPEWPYDFLDTSTAAVFVWLQLLFCIYALFFFAWRELIDRKLKKYLDGGESYDCLTSHA